MKFDKMRVVSGTTAINEDTFVVGCIDPQTDKCSYIIGVTRRAADVAEAFKEIKILNSGSEYDYLVAEIPVESWKNKKFNDTFIDMGVSLLIGDPDSGNKLDVSIETKREFVESCYKYWQYCIKQYGTYTEKTVDKYNGKKFLNDFSQAISVFGLYADNKKELFKAIDFSWKTVINRKERII